jgi:hypothetical protein
MDSEPLRNELLTSQWYGISPGNINYTGGNVGIGTINPVTPLQVIGNISTTGNVGIGNTNPIYPLEVNDVTSGLVTRVNFNGNVTDEKGAVSFTQGNGVLPYVGGQVGLAGNFSGNSVATTPAQWYYSSPPVSQPPFSFCFWFNPQSTTFYGTIMSLSNGSNFTYMNIDYGTPFNANNSLGFFIDLNTQWAILGTIVNTGAMTLGTWYHVCITVTSAWVTTCYLNGVQTSTQTGTGNFPSAPTRFIIGGNGDGTVGGVPSRGANFYMDDLRWYNRALSASEIASIYALNSIYSAKSIVSNGSIISLGGNIGIGSTSPVTNLDITKTTTTGTPALEIRGGGGGPRLQVYGRNADAQAWMGFGTDMAGGPYENSVFFPNANSGTQGFLTIGSYNGSAYSEKMRILVGGNVGVGTNNPQAPFHVYKSGGGGVVQGEIRVCSDDNQKSRVGMYEESAGSTWGCWMQYNGNGDTMEFGSKRNTVDTSPQMTISSTGTVNIPGVITNPGRYYIMGYLAGGTTGGAYISLGSQQAGNGMVITSSNKLVAPVSGLYQFGFSTIMNSSSVRNDVSINVNGTSIVNTLSEDSTAGYHYRHGSVCYYLSANDYVQFYCGSGSIYNAFNVDAWHTFYFFHIG